MYVAVILHKGIGILAFGSLIRDPGPELERSDVH